MILGFFVVLLVGMLVGHLLSYHNRAEDDARFVSLDKEHKALKKVASERKDRQDELRRELRASESEREQIASLTKELQQANIEYDRQHRSSNLRITELEHQLGEAIADASEKTSRSEAFHDELNHARRDVIARDEERQRLIQELESVRAAFDSLNEQRTELATVDETTYTTEIQALQTELARARGDAASVNAKYEQLHDKMSDAYAKLTLAEERCEIAQRERDEATKQAAAQQNLVATMREQAKKLEADNDSAYAELEQIRTGTAATEAGLEDKLRSTEALVEQLTQQQAELESERQQISQHLEDSRIDNARLTLQLEQIPELQSKLEVANQNSEAADSSTQEIAAKLSKRNEDVLALQSQLAASEQLVSDVISQLQEMKDSHHLLTEQLKTVKALCRTLEAENKKIETLQSELDATRKELDEEVALKLSMCSTSDQQSAAIANLEDELKALKGVYEIAEQSLGKSQAANIQLVGELGELRSIIASNDADREALAQCNDELRDQVNTLESEAQHLQQQITGAANNKHVIDAMHTEMQTTAAALDAQAEKHNVLQKQYEESLLRNGSLQHEVADLQVHCEQLEAAKQTLESQQSRIDETTKENERLHEKVRDLTQQAEAIGELQKTLDAVQADYDSRTETLAAFATERQTAIDRAMELEKLTAELKEERAEMSDQLARQIQHFDAATESVKQLTTEVTALRIDLDSATRELESQSLKICKLNEEVAEKDILTSDLQDLRSQLHKTTTSFDRLSAEYNDSLDANAQAEEQIRILQQRVHESTAKIRELRREIGENTTDEGPHILPFPNSDAA